MNLRNSQPVSWRVITWDVALILLIVLLAEASRFTWKQGRHLISADSVQYVDGALALLDENATPHFEFRKPGYSIFLAGVSLLMGNLGWAVVVAQRCLQALLPVAAYGLGLNLHSRRAGWLAALLLVARLFFEHRAERIMSEVLYTVLLSFGALALSRALSRPRGVGWMVVSGTLLAAAWLTRSVAAVWIAAGVACILWTRMHMRRAALLGSVAVLIPVLGAYLGECAWNHAASGRALPCTGTFGPAMLMRARYMGGMPLPDSDAARKCLALLPERDINDAYLSHPLDTWVAWHRAIREKNLDDWEVDALMKRCAMEMIAANAGAYARNTAVLFLRCALRRVEGPSVSLVPPVLRESILLPEGVVRTPEEEERWYAHWALPHRAPESAATLVNAMTRAQHERAPFGGSGAWAWLRYYSMRPPVSDILATIADFGSIWPGLAMLGCGLLGLNKRTCAFLATGFLLEALVIAATVFSSLELARFQFVWIGMDTALAACLIAASAEAVMQRHKARKSQAHCSSTS